LYSYLKAHRKRLVYLPLIIYWIILLIATSIPTDDFPRVLLTVGDKLKHFIAYFILGGYLTVAFSVQEKIPLLRKHFILGAILTATIYGLVDEIHQAFIPGRFYELLDWVADIIGACVGSIFVGVLLRKYVHSNYR
jgi:VanZ family protein